MTNAKGVLEWMAWEKKRKANMTNEEWLKSLTTKELAKWIRRKTHGNDEYNEEVELAWEGWLKDKHKE